MLYRGPGGAAGRPDRRGDLAVGEPGRPGCGHEFGQDGFVAGFGGTAGGPEQAVVPVALVLLLDPGGEVAQVAALNPGRAGGGVAFGFEQAGDLAPIQAAGLLAVADDLVGPAAYLGGRGDDVAALGAKVKVVARQLAAVLVAAGEVGVQPAAGSCDDRARAV